MVSRTAAASTPKSIRRRDEILRCATVLFDGKGYANTSVDDIAKEVGIAREGIYYYFRNRAEILLNIIEPQSRALIEGLRIIVDDESLDHRDKLHAAIRNHLEQFDRRCLEMTVSLREGYLEDAEDVRATMGLIWKEYEQMWTDLIRAGQTGGAFRPMGDAKMLAFGVLGICNWLARWYDPSKPASIDELIKTYFELIGHGLLAD